MAWTDERVATLKRLWADGHSASQIAGRLGGVTRNSVISKVHRLGLSGRSTRHRKPQSNRPRKSFQGQASVRPVMPVEPYRPQPEPFVVPPHERKALEELESWHCRWPCTSAPPHAFCGRRKLPGLPYCEDHARIAYRGPETSPRVAPFVLKPMVVA